MFDLGVDGCQWRLDCLLLPARSSPRAESTCLLAFEPGRIGQSSWVVEARVGGVGPDYVIYHLRLTQSVSHLGMYRVDKTSKQMQVKLVGLSRLHAWPHHTCLMLARGIQ